MHIYKASAKAITRFTSNDNDNNDGGGGDDPFPLTACTLKGKVSLRILSPAHITSCCVDDSYLFVQGQTEQKLKSSLKEELKKDVKYKFEYTASTMSTDMKKSFEFTIKEEKTKTNDTD